MLESTPTRLRTILDMALENCAPSKQDARYLLRFAPESLEAAVIRSVADQTTRKRFDNTGIVMGQIGLEMAPCPGACRFCMFSVDNGPVPLTQMPREDVRAAADAFARGGADGIFVMTMHTFGFDHYLELAAEIIGKLSPDTRFFANVGDVTLEQARQLKQIGIHGAYHVVRLREGRDTKLDPVKRRETIIALKEAGIDWYTSCEPIGPEHTVDELVEQLYLGPEFGCTQHAAMRRFLVPSSPLFPLGQISLSRLAQIVAVIALANLENSALRSICVHEPNLLGITSGANGFYAESGELSEPSSDETGELDDGGFTSATWRQASPYSTDACRKLLREAGFSAIVVGKSARQLREAA
jgi:biotin synthase